MVSGPHTGYVFYIADPRLPQGKNIIYIGNGELPWISVSRHLNRSSNKEMRDWVDKLREDFPEGFEILGRIVADRWHGDARPIPELRPGVTRIEWGILDYDPETAEEEDGVKMAGGTRKNFWIAKLLKEGHALVNKKAGRPRNPPRRSHA